MKKISFLIIMLFVLTVMSGCNKDAIPSVSNNAEIHQQVDDTTDKSTVAEKESVFEIVTNMTKLYYPKKWQDRLTVDAEGKSISFTSNGTRLFDFIFGGTEGTLLGWYDGVEVRIISWEIVEVNYTEEEYFILRAMQEDIDIVIEHLIDDNKFVLN